MGWALEYNIFLIIDNIPYTLSHTSWVRDTILLAHGMKHECSG